MQPTWYGRFELKVDGAAFWQIGPYQLWAQRTACEWKLASAPCPIDVDKSSVVEVPTQCEQPPEGAKVQRFGFKKSPDSITLTPALADRPVVVSPEQPLFLAPLEEVCLYISTPVWVEVKLGDSPLALLDEPTHRPTDSWFGPSSMKGELCYATRTAARMNLEKVPLRPDRAISMVEIRNRAKGILSVEKIKIPVIHQSIYVVGDGSLWTETVTLNHTEDGALAAVRLGKGPPDILSDATLIRGPRSEMDPGLLTRAFGGFLPSL